MIFRFFFLVIFAIQFDPSFAQLQNGTKENNSDYNPDTLSAAEQQEINNNYRRTGWGYMLLTDSCSKAGDSINASKYFMKIDPYILFLENIVPDSMDEYIHKHYNITSNARKEYINYYKKMYNKPKSIKYNKFKDMEQEDQKDRNDLENCTDTLCAAVLAKKMRHEDSIHFEYLYDYVLKYGWPSLTDGSLYAGIIAIHDRVHSEDYIPYLKKAVLNGTLDISTLSFILYWNAHANDYSQKLREYINKGKYFSIDVSSMLDNKMPSESTLHKIREIVKKHCPVKFIYVNEVHDKQKQIAWCNKILPRQIDVLSLLSEDLAYYNCNLKQFELYCLQTGCYSVYWQPSDHTDMKMIIYIMYDRNDTIKKQFDKILTDKKFVTHAINFDVNQSTLKPGSIDFMQQLVNWLKQNPTIKLEIDGHTDSDGDPEANIKLSQARADEVKKQLVILGVDSTRLTTKGFGASKPIKSNVIPEGKAENRRVEFIKQ